MSHLNNVTHPTMPIISDLDDDQGYQTSGGSTSSISGKHHTETCEEHVHLCCHNPAQIHNHIDP